MTVSELTEKEQKYYNFLNGKKYRYLSDLVATMNSHANTVYHTLQNMREKGVWLVEKKDKQKVMLRVRLWSAKNNLHECTRCQSIKRKHKGNGLCLSCHDKKRAKNPNRKAQLKNQHDRWYERVKNTPEYREYTEERARVWRDTSEAYPLFLQRQYRKGRALRAVLNKRNLKKNEKGIVYRCQCCDKMVKTPYTHKDIKDNFREYSLYRQYMEMKHQGMLPTVKKSKV